MTLYAMRLPRLDLAAVCPSFAAMLFTPVVWFDVPMLRILVTVAEIGLLALLAHLWLAGWPRRRHQARAVLLITGIGVWPEPGFWTRYL
ncbi:hypothetical protein P3T39_005504 [Kitasatospora sp. GP82]|nr:hypothetical protein [Kitasatospora sp. GP82]